MSEMQIIGTNAPLLCDCGCGTDLSGTKQFMIIAGKMYIYGHHPEETRLPDRHAEGVAAGLEMAAKLVERSAGLDPDDVATAIRALKR